jgi:hypothetical protein
MHIAMIVYTAILLLAEPNDFRGLAACKSKNDEYY